MSARSLTEHGLRRVGLSGIALIIVAPLTVILVAYTLFHTPPVPVSAAVAVTSLSVSRHSPAPAKRPTTTATVAAGPQVVAFLGDSYAAGTGASEPSKRWTDLVSSTKGWVQKNLSNNTTSYSTVGAAGSTSYLAQLGAVVATGAQIVVVSGGRNDARVDPAQLRTDVRATLAGIHAGLPKAKVIVVSPTWGDESAPDRLVAVIAVVKQEAHRAGASYLDIGEPMFGHTAMMALDGWHPNDSGHAAIAAAVEKALG